ncbi:hypothetical protein BBJ28_00005441 [Nothophytophthora sp. Chile5]|nr:hypothetical protein BBJ28_00005441 [Nothophytophthora sp. Chile5]
MKFFAPILMAVVAVFSAQVDANGVCYDPDHATSKSASTVAADMETIAGYGFTSVRTYISMFGTTEMGPIITAAGLTAALGVPYPQSDYEDQMTAAISAANSGGVAYIFVGNENLAGASSVPSAMISVIESIKSQVPDSVKVGTVQRNTEVINYSSISGWSDLVSACDVLGVNVHPFFTSGTTADDAINVVNTQWETMMSNFGDKLLLTETGWPSSGSYSGNTGSSSGTETFYGDYQSWSSSLSEKFYFQMFDTPSKSEAYEQTFGLLTYDSQSKFTMSTTQTTTTTTSAPTTEAPTTEAPTTEAPTTEAPTTEAPTTEAPTTEAPTTEAPATEAPTATPEATTATPEVTTEAPETYSASASASVAGEADYNSTDASTSDEESVELGSASFSEEEVGSSSSSSYGDVDVSDESVADDADIESVKSTTTKSSTATAGTSSTGTSSDAQKATGQDDGSTQEASTQSSGSSAGTTVGIAVAGGACAVLMAFGFIYQTRKRAQELEAEEEKRESFSAMTPVENICAL